MTSISTTTPTARAAILLVALVVASSLLYVENHVALISWAGDSDSGSASNQTVISLFDDQQERPQQHESRRRLASRKPLLDEETQLKQMKSYLGGLYPRIDKDTMPLYLRDTEDETEVHVPSGLGVSRNRDLIFFWHIPKASGSTMKNILNFCFDLKRAERVSDKASMEFVRENVLNMDTSSPEGLSFSFENQLANSNMVDVIVSNYFLSGSALFTDLHYGKTFAILRHPVDLALSLFYYRRKASWERSYRNDWMKVTFEDYISSDDYMDSWMVRQLTGTMPWVELDETHLERAKTLVRRKILIGIVDQMDETVRQLKAHFGWQEKTPYCSYNMLHSTPLNKNEHPELEGGRGGALWNIIVEKEKWDLSLYHYALELFAEQSLRYPAQ